MADRHWVFWDGDCGFCGRCVAWFKRHDMHDKLVPIPYQEAPFPPMTDAIFAGCPDAVHVLAADGRTLVAGRAVAFILGEIGWRKTAWLLGLWPIAWFNEIGYGIVARNRMFFSRFLFTRE